jgi:hypothetical protein
VIRTEVEPWHTSHLLENIKLIWQVAFFFGMREIQQDRPRPGVHFFPGKSLLLAVRFQSVLCWSCDGIAWVVSPDN